MAWSGVLALVAACADGSGPGPGEDGVEGPDGKPTVAITAPADGDGSYDGRFAIAWEVEGLVLDATGMGEAPAERHGHVHVYLDDQLVEETGASGTEVEGLAAGVHTVRVRLAENDHTELDASANVEVEVLAPRVRLLSPADGAALVASSVPLVLSVEDFTLVDAVGDPDRFGEGHFRILVDGALRDWGADPALAAATGLAEGAHTVTVELVTNDGRPLDPPATAEVRVIVPAGARGVYWDRAAFDDAWTSATVPLSLHTSAFTLFPVDSGRPPADGEGHLHLFLDGAWLDATAEPTRLLQHVAPGAHLLEARLVTNDAFELPILDRMWVTVAADRPDVVVSYPGPSWRMATAFDLLYTVENFTLDAAAMNGAPSPGTGHAVVSIDGVPVAQTASTTVPLSGLLPGTHALRVELVGNDGLPLAPPVWTEFPVVVE